MNESAGRARKQTDIGNILVRKRKVAECGKKKYS